MGEKELREKEKREGGQEHIKGGEEMGRTAGRTRRRGHREGKDTMTEIPVGRQKHSGKTRFSLQVLAGGRRTRKACMT